MPFAFWTIISIICYLNIHYQIISFWYEKLYPGVMSHLKSESVDTINYYLLTEFDGNKPVVNTKRLYLPLENGLALHLYKFEFPSPNNAMRQVWLKMAQWFYWRFSVRVGAFRYFVIIFLLKGCGLLFEQACILYARMVILNWFWRRRRKCEKFTKTITPTTKTTTNKLVRKAHLSLRFR